jgi:SAM-dependent methyltransferase
MIVTFRSFQDFEGWSKFPSFIEELIVANSSMRICEIGAGANPALTQEMVLKHGLQYKAIDESENEVAKSNMAEMSAVDICTVCDKLQGSPYDMIISRMAAEHFQDATKAYRNMFESLAPNGLCVHSFATLYSMPFLLNRLLPDSVTDYLLNAFSPRERDMHDKFKAYYSHCRGPVLSQVRFFQSIGYDVLEYRGYFGHSYYRSKMPFIHSIEMKKVQLLLKVPIPYLTSYATVILRRPPTT